MGHLRVFIENETPLKEHMSQLNVHFWGAAPSTPTPGKSARAAWEK